MHIPYLVSVYKLTNFEINLPGHSNLMQLNTIKSPANVFIQLNMNMKPKLSNLHVTFVTSLKTNEPPVKFKSGVQLTKHFASYISPFREELLLRDLYLPKIVKCVYCQLYPSEESNYVTRNDFNIFNFLIQWYTADCLRGKITV